MVSMDKAFLAKKQASLRGADLKLFVRDVRDRQGRKRPITIRSWSTIKDVKDTIQQAIHIPASSQRLFFGPLLTSGKELPNHRSLHDAGIYRSGETILLDIKGSTSSLSSVMSAFSMQSEVRSDICISSSVIDATPKLLRQLVQRARRALALGLKPEFILEGSGGTYFLHDARKAKIAVFKPADEEPYAENNPRGYLQQTTGQHMYLREGVVPGEACIREVAAFMVDHAGFSNVPMTTLVEARHPSFNTNGARLKVSEGGASIGAHSITQNSHATSALAKKVGSFQEFVRSECSMDDISPSMVSVDEVHKIAILDIRLMNADRNSANLLCRRRSDNTIQLVPIDHGFCLRSVADVSWMDWCWLDWPQTKQPISKETRDYILSLDIERDARLLRERLNISREALDYFCASSSLLKAGVRAGLSLYDIAVMCCRNDDLGEVPSKLEMLFSMASELAESAVENGRWHHAAASRALEEQLSPKGGSLFAHTQSKAVHKTMSAVDLSNYSEDLASFSADAKKGHVPGMIQSSASDSSSDNGEADRDDCEEWAANLIADVSIDQSMNSIAKKTRSISIESDSSNESEAEGFWYTNPGASPDSSVASDEESVNWSPMNSPQEASFLELSASSLRNSFNPFTTARRASIILAPDEMNESFKQFRNTPSKVTFADQPDISHEREQRGLSVHPEFKHSNSDVGHSDVPEPPRPEMTMRRSQSYSALSSTLAEKLAEEEDTSIMHRPVDPEHYREYFLKFIDLVIVRETTAASQLKTEA